MTNFARTASSLRAFAANFAYRPQEQHAKQTRQRVVSERRLQWYCWSALGRETTSGSAKPPKSRLPDMRRRPGPTIWPRRRVIFKKSLEGQFSSGRTLSTIGRVDYSRWSHDSIASSAVLAVNAKQAISPPVQQRPAESWRVRQSEPSKHFPDCVAVNFCLANQDDLYWHSRDPFD